MSLRVFPIGLKEAKDFVDKYHRHHNAPVGHKFSICVKDDEGVLQGVAICGRPVSRMLDNGVTLEINRLCSLGEKNVCSKLYGACVRIARDMGYKRVVTYTLASENGASLKASNFHCDGIAGKPEWTGKRGTGTNGPHEMKTRWSKDLY